MKRKKKSASRRHGEILSVDTYSLMGDPDASNEFGCSWSKLLGNSTNPIQFWFFSHKYCRWFRFLVESIYQLRFILILTIVFNR